MRIVSIREEVSRSVRMMGFRRLRAFVTVIALSSGLLACASLARAAHEVLTNIVMIVSDDQGWGDYGFMKHPSIETPRLDALASEGLTLSRGYVPSSVCRPSLATIVTGLYPHQHGIVSNDPSPPRRFTGQSRDRYQNDRSYLKQRRAYLRHIDGVDTLPKMLHAKGYLSHQSGKWWEGDFARGGFTHGMTHGDPARGGRAGDDGLRIGRTSMQPIFDFIDLARAKEAPFLVFYAPVMPHLPHDPPQRLLTKYTTRTDHPALARYWAMCEWFDETVGELLDFIDQRQLANHTLILFVADNGWINRESQSGFAKRSKLSPNEGGVRTPIVLRWPGVIAPGRNDLHLASSIDLVPTVLAAVGLPTTPQMQGVNLLDAQALASRKAIHGEIFHHNAQHPTKPMASLQYRWIIEANWKLIAPNPRLLGTSRVELYDVVRDPEEQKDLAREHKDIAKHLTREIDRWLPLRQTP
jgi:uncharacterized sulfatase